MTVSLRACADVRACDLGPALVLVSYRTGAVQVLTGPSRHWWLQAARTGLVDENAPVVKELLSAGMVESQDEPASSWPLATGALWEPNWGTHELPMGFSPTPGAPLFDHTLAAAGLLTVLTASVMGRREKRMSRLVSLVRAASKRARHSVTPQRAEQMVHAVRRLGAFSPLRTACLEESVAATLALALTGRRVHWCHGVMADPILLHAWIAVDGEPIAEPASTRKCVVLLELPSTKENT